MLNILVRMDLLDLLDTALDLAPDDCTCGHPDVAGVGRRIEIDATHLRLVCTGCGAEDVHLRSDLEDDDEEDADSDGVDLDDVEWSP